MSAPAQNLDASKLPDHAFGVRTVLGWGTWGFIAVESAIFAVLIASYLYGMGKAETWPPPPFSAPALSYGIINTLIMLATVVPNVIYKRAAERMQLRTTQRCLVVLFVLECAFLVVRGLEFAGLAVRWDDNFYGSMLWVLLGFHTIHVFSDVVETAVLFALSLRKGIRPHRFADMFDNAFFWYFAVWVWLPLFALIYLVPRWN
ncbi:MAG: cytochrome C oxidase subunit III [Opitutus sp.]|nr:cytochrome C oxidase subunit III [Opitutus sp.]